MATEYELTYHVDAGLDEEARGQVHARVEEQLTSLSGAVVHDGGNKRARLAYPVKKKMSAFIRSAQIELEQEHVQTLQEFLKKADGVLRFMILRTPRRERVDRTKLEQKAPQKEEKKAPRKKPADVTMEDVEKGIEEALTEEVK